MSANVENLSKMLAFDFLRENDDDDDFQVADIGDVRANLYNLTAMADEVTKQYGEIFR